MMDNTRGNQHGLNNRGASPSTQSIQENSSTASTQTWSSAVDNFTVPEEAGSSSAQTWPPDTPSRPIVVTSHVKPPFPGPGHTYQDPQPQGGLGPAPKDDPTGTQASSDGVSGVSPTPTPPHRVQPSPPRSQSRPESSNNTTSYPQGAPTTAMPPHARAPPPAPDSHQVHGHPWHLQGGGAWLSELDAWAWSTLEIEMRRWLVHSVKSAVAPGTSIVLPDTYGSVRGAEVRGEFCPPAYGNGVAAAGPPWPGPAVGMAVPNTAQPGIQRAMGGESATAEPFGAGGAPAPAHVGTDPASARLPNFPPVNGPPQTVAEDAQTAVQQRPVARRAPAVLTIEAAARRGRWRKSKAAQQCHCPHCSYHHHRQQQQQQQQQPGAPEGGREDPASGNAQTSSEAPAPIPTATMTATSEAIKRRVRRRDFDKYHSYARLSISPISPSSTLAVPPVQEEKTYVDDYDDAAAVAAAAVVLRDCAAAVERLRRKVEDVWEEGGTVCAPWYLST